MTAAAALVCRAVVTSSGWRIVLQLLQQLIYSSATALAHAPAGAHLSFPREIVLLVEDEERTDGRTFVSNRA